MVWFVVVVLAVFGSVVGLISRTIRSRGCAGTRTERAQDAEADPQSLWREMQIASVRFVTEAGSDPGHRIVVEKRRIGVVADTRDEAERELRLKAARLGANGVTYLTSTTRPEKYQAGVGPKGNPYFRTREVKEWEGTAVAAVPLGKWGWLARLFGSRDEKLAVLDGSNVLHAAGQGPDWASVRSVVTRLREGGWTLHVFFDANVGYKAFGRHVSERELARALDLKPKQVTIVPSGRQADPYVMAFARKHRGVIVTNDLYRDNVQMMQGLARLGVEFNGRGVRVG